MTQHPRLMAQRHPAYADPSYPTNSILKYMFDEQLRETWAEPSAIVGALYLVISRGQRIPLRLPLGPDAWGSIIQDLEETKKELDELKEISVGAGNPKQLEVIRLLN